MKKTFRQAIVMLLALGLLAGCAGASGRRGEEGPFSRTATIDRGPIEVQVSGTGQIEAEAQSALSFETSGNVGAIHVEVGDTVQTNDVLIELDPATTEVAIASAEAELIEAEQQLENLIDPENHAVRLAEARRTLAQSREALDDAQYLRRVRQKGNRADEQDLDAAEARLHLAEDAVDEAKSAYDRLSGLDEEDPSRAQARRQLALARDERDAAERALNWLTGSPTEIEQAQLDADVAVAEANLKQAQERVDTLLEGPDPDEVAAAEARVRAARARVGQAKITAPFAGTILAVNYRIGDRVTIGQPAVSLADLDPLHVETTIDELDIAQVEPGQEATLSLDALPDVTLRGEVASVDLAPPGTEGTTEYPVIVNLIESDPRVRVGMTTAVDILVARKEDVLLIPNWALRFDSETGEVFARVQTETGTERRNLELGLRNETESEVLAGLEAGDVVGIADESNGNPAPGPFGGGG